MAPVFDSFSGWLNIWALRQGHKASDLPSLQCESRLAGSVKGKFHFCRLQRQNHLPGDMNLYSSSQTERTFMSRVAGDQINTSHKFANTN